MSFPACGGRHDVVVTGVGELKTRSIGEDVMTSKKK
jgi:hypothetical protein